MHEIVLPETKPETEWVLGRPVQKVSPTTAHSVLQLVIGSRLLAWAEGRGEAGSEWRFRITPPGEITRPLVPDLAYVSDERMKQLAEAEREVPRLAPDIVVEILSPDDRPANVRHKREVYLSAGTTLVLIVDPERRTLDVFEAGGKQTAYVREATFSDERFPGLTLSLGEIFARLDRRLA